MNANPPSPLKRYQDRAELSGMGRNLRKKTPRTSHAKWVPSARSRKPLQILEASNRGRLPNLVPIRHGRMLQSPFAFYRGGAALMASDLATTPNMGARVQVCGDCHLLNFGAFATPERKLIFDINDFDETIPGPWEWDVKRLAASFIVASRANHYTEAQARDACLGFLRSYRKKMAEYAEMRSLEIWYDQIDVLKEMGNFEDPEARQRAKRRLKKVTTQNVVEDDFPKLAHADKKDPVIRDNPPLIFHHQRLDQKGFAANVEKAFARYRDSLPHERRVLLDRYQLKDIAVKVVGVGSVGTFCAIMLMMAGDQDPLFLQVKEARRSVLEPYVEKSLYKNRGQRVVTGQRLMQSASDLFLGWTVGQEGRHFYIRQLRDMKMKPLVELFSPGFMEEYAAYCGWALAHGHARSGQPSLLAGYLGKGDVFDESVTEFAVAYADQNERDYDELLKAAKAGRIEAYFENG